VIPRLPATWQSKNYDGTLIEVIVGDMTTFQVDAIVNAANIFLRGRRINRLIHEAAGPGLLAELSRLYPGEPAGEVGYAYPTRAHNIQTAQYIIHAIGPFYNAGREEQARMDLHAAYYNSMEQAMALGARTIAFPAISTGAYGVPNDLAAMIAMEAVREFLDREANCFFSASCVSDPARE
jgi:O-acetyl-ADP-ribose deacetylase (regulator of RNase III)